MKRLLSLSLALLLGGTLGACGDDSRDDSPSGGAALEQVSIEGDFGNAPTVEWNGPMEADGLSSEVLTEGDGEEVQSGDQVLAHVWIGNGHTEKEAYSSYEAQPQVLTVKDPLPPMFIEGMEGHTIGSRVAVAASPADAFGEMGNPQIGIGNKDSVLLVVDLVEMYVPPKPKDVSAGRMPGVVEEKGKPVSLDFSGVPEPEAEGGDLLRAVLEKGKGKQVTTDMTVTANYLGMVHGARKPFDESFSKKPVPFQLTGVVEGWTYGLEGVPVGSRVLLQIPPDLGYGAQEQPGIPADSTLYFVIDVVAAK